MSDVHVVEMFHRDADLIHHLRGLCKETQYSKFTWFLKIGKFGRLRMLKLRTSFGKSAVLPVLYPLEQLSALHAETKGNVRRESEESCSR